MLLKKTRASFSLVNLRAGCCLRWRIWQRRQVAEGGEQSSGSQRGDVPIPTVKQKAAAGGDGKNRQAPGDMGNPVTVQGVEGQLAAVATPYKKAVVGAADLAVGKGCAEAVKPNVTVKPLPEEIIKISSDTNEPNDPVHDIDALDANDQLAVVDYVEDIYKIYKLAENSSRPNDYMGSLVEIDAEGRANLADWLIKVHHYDGLKPEALHLTFYIIDRYLSMETVPRNQPLHTHVRQHVLLRADIEQGERNSEET